MQMLRPVMQHAGTKAQLYARHIVQCSWLKAVKPTPMALNAG